jgi:hypothetical protein
MNMQYFRRRKVTRAHLAAMRADEPHDGQRANGLGAGSSLVRSSMTHRSAEAALE